MKLSIARRVIAAAALLLGAHLVAHAGSAEHEAGRKIYNFRCYYCHGYSGDAATLATTFLTPPPRNFQLAEPREWPRERILRAVRDGVPGTAMKPFASVLSPREIALVSNFVRREFIESRARNTQYHTKENGWPDHDRYAAAFPFATGELPIDSPAELLDDGQRAGLHLFLKTCISCHDRARVLKPGPAWEKRPVSFPRAGYDHRVPLPDSVVEASPYGRHDIPPSIADLNTTEKDGERLFQANCAFCHAADGTGRNWIGRFMEPHARDLTDPVVMRTMTRERLIRTIRDGLNGTSMPAWRDVLTQEQVESIAAYINRAFHPLARTGP